MNRHRLTSLTAALGLGAAVLALIPAGAAAKPQAKAIVPQVLNCRQKAVMRPTGVFVLSCADGNMLLKSTKWKAWTAKEATGTTTFGLNLCKPYCAASRISFFPHSTVRFYDPKQTKKGLLFRRLKVSYRLHGKPKIFSGELID